MNGDVIYYQRPNFRSREWEQVSEKTREFIHLVFDKGETLDCAAVELHFPERFLNQAERSEFMNVVEKYAPDLELMVVHTNDAGLATDLQRFGLLDYLSSTNTEGLAEEYSEECPTL